MTRRAIKNKLRLAVSALALGAMIVGPGKVAAQSACGQQRLALVIGEASYKAGPLATAANDAGLVADTLQQAGFDVTGAADLDQDGLRKSLREFVEKAAAAGPNAIVFIYLSGRAVQYAGENYLAPIDATIAQAASVPLEAIRLNDYLQPLSQMPLAARIVVIDGARINPFAQNGQGLAGGLTLVEPTAGGLYAYNAAPDTVAPDEAGPYGIYAQSLTEMLREGGLPVDQAFARARLRVAERTKGAQTPWDETKLSCDPPLFARAANAPAPVVPLESQANLRARPIRDYPVEQAYGAALEIDTISAYTDFLNAYPNSAYAARVRAMLAARREAVTWRRAYMANSPSAYWTYLQRYARGPHAEDARRRLAAINAALAPPPRFDVYEFDVPPPMESEEVYFRRPYMVFDDDSYGAPPPMTYLLPPEPPLLYEAPPRPPHQSLLPLPLLAAPLLFAIPAVRHGLFSAPAVVQATHPAANSYYGARNAQPSPAGGPGAAPSAPGGPAAPVGGAPLPHPGGPGVPVGGAPLPHPAGPGAPVGGAPLPHPGAPAGGLPLPHPAASAPTTPVGGAPLPHPGGASVPTAPSHVAPSVTPPPAHSAPVAPPPPHVAPVAPPPAHSAPVAPPPPHVAPVAPPPVHSAPVAPPPPHVAPPPPHVAAPPPPHVAAPPPPHVAAPPPPHVAPPAPHVAPPPHAEPHKCPPDHPHC